MKTFRFNQNNVEIADDGDEVDEIDGDEEIEDYVPPAVDPRSATLAERIREAATARGNHAWRLVDPRTREYSLNYNEPVEGSVLRVRWDRMPYDPGDVGLIESYANEEGSDVDAIARDLYGVLQTCARERISPGDAYDAGYPVWVGDRKVLWNDLVDWMPVPPPPPPDPLEAIRDQAQDMCDEDLAEWAAELLELDPEETAVLRAILDGVDRRAMVRCGYEA